jgi:hypothetical protein
MSDTTLMTDETIPVGGNQQTAEPTGGQPATTGDATNQQQTQGQSGDVQQQGTQDGQGNNQKAPEGAPENYEFKAPEGHEYDSSVINAFSEAAKELNIPLKLIQLGNNYKDDVYKENLILYHTLIPMFSSLKSRKKLQ